MPSLQEALMARTPKAIPTPLTPSTSSPSSTAPPATPEKPVKADPLAELTVRFVEAGVVQVEELARVVLAASPTWATLAFLAHERDRDTGDWKAPRVSLRRYKKRGGRFIVDKHFTLTNRNQAQLLAQSLASWFDAGGPGDTGAATDTGDASDTEDDDG